MAIPHPLPPILAEGRQWLVIDKPSGLAVHPGPATPHSLEQLLPAYAPGRPAPQPVHRLDRDTSGCLLLARRPSALRALSAAFAAGEVEKIYWAMVANPPAGDSGTIDAPLAKLSNKAKGWRMVPDPEGKPARTGWRILQRMEGEALVEFRPQTGRTHQIRVHATLLGPGAAIVGDAVYGSAAPTPLLLHARELHFPEPGTQERNRAVAPLPARFRIASISEKGDPSP